MKTLKFELVTPKRVAFSEEVNEVLLPTTQGQIGVLPGHLPIVTSLKTGEIIIKKGTETIYLAISGGFCEVTQNRVRVLADTAERAEEINEMRAIEARKRAEGLVKEAKDDVVFSDATAALERALIRAKVAQRKRKHHAQTM